MSVVLPVGTHLLADFHGVAPALLRDGVALDGHLREAAAAAGARVLSSHFHVFGDASGITGVVLLCESHLSVHTWPETGYAAIDIFMCGAADPKVALAVLRRLLEPAEARCSVVSRCGELPQPL